MSMSLLSNLRGRNSSLVVSRIVGLAFVATALALPRFIHSAFISSD